MDIVGEKDTTTRDLPESKTTTTLPRHPRDTVTPLVPVGPTLSRVAIVGSSPLLDRMVGHVRSGQSPEVPDTPRDTECE